MLEFHDVPHGPWYARIDADGSTVFNPAVPDAEALLMKNHPEIAENAKKTAAYDKFIDGLRTKIKSKGPVVGDDALMLAEINKLKPEKK